MIPSFLRSEPEKIEPPFLLCQRLQVFFVFHWRGLVALVAPIIIAVILMFFDMDKLLRYGYFCFFVMAVYWLTECIPIMITALFPLIVFPMSGLKSTNDVAREYFNHPTFLLCGALMIAYSCAQSGLSRRVAMCGINLFGNTHYRIFSSMVLITAFASHWIPNTAAVVVAIPLVYIVLTEFQTNEMMQIMETTAEKKSVASLITSVYFSMLIIAAALGGMSCLIGSATNIAFKGLFDVSLPHTPELLAFLPFSMFALPTAIIIQIVIYIYTLLRRLIGKSTGNSNMRNMPRSLRQDLKSKLSEERKKFGRWTCWETMVVIFFTLAMVLFYTRNPYVFDGWLPFIIQKVGIVTKYPHLYITDSTVAILVTCLMCLFPAINLISRYKSATVNAEIPAHRAYSVIDWYSCDPEFPYSLLFVLGSGFALIYGNTTHGEANLNIARFLNNLNGFTAPEALIFAVTIVTAFFSNMAKNLVVIILLFPIMLELSILRRIHPLWLMLAVGFPASLNFCWACCAPGNAIAKRAAQMTTWRMLMLGAGPVLIGIVIMYVFILYWARIIWNFINLPTDFPPRS